MQRPGPALAAHQDPVADPSRSGAQILGHRHEGVAHERRHRVGVVQDVGRFLGGEPMVHRDGHGPEGARGRHGQEILQRVLRVDHDVLALAQPPVAQGVGQPVAAIPQLRPGHHLVAGDDGRAIGLLSGPVGDEVDGNLPRSSMVVHLRDVSPSHFGGAAMRRANAVIMAILILAAVGLVRARPGRSRSARRLPTSRCPRRGASKSSWATCWARGRSSSTRSSRRSPPREPARSWTSRRPCRSSKPWAPRWWA